MLPEGLLQVGTARAEQDELDSFAHHPAVVLMDEVHALLVVQAAYEAQHWDVRPHRQAQLLYSQKAQSGRRGGTVKCSEVQSAVCPR